MAGLGHRGVGTALTQGEYEAADTHEVDGQTAGDLLIAQDATTLTRIPIGVGVLTGDGTDADWEAVVAGLLLSDDDPEDVGATASEGTGTTASRNDHVHEYGDLSDLTALTSLASGDKLYLSDVSDSNAVKATTLTSLASQLAGTNITASAGVLSVAGAGLSASSANLSLTNITSNTSITSMGAMNLSAGSWLLIGSCQYRVANTTNTPLFLANFYLYEGSSTIVRNMTVAVQGNGRVPVTLFALVTPTQLTGYSMRIQRAGAAATTQRGDQGRLYALKYA